MLLNSHISAYTRCFAGKVCGLVRSTWGTSQGEDKLGAGDKILNTKVARRACAEQTFPQSALGGLKHTPSPAPFQKVWSAVGDVKMRNVAFNKKVGTCNKATRHVHWE